MPKAFLLDIDYVKEPNKAGIDEGIIRLVLRADGKVLFRNVHFHPYFYYAGKLPTELKDIPQVSGIEEVGMELDGKKVKVHKVVCYNPSDVPKLRDIFGKFGRCYEYDIPFVKRFIIDTGINVFSTIDYKELEGDYIEVYSSSDDMRRLNAMAFDIETYNPHGIPRPKEDPLLMISYSMGDKSKGVITYGKTENRHAVKAKDERDTIDKFCKLVREEDIDILYGYNSSQFDLPYIRERAAVIKAPFVLGRDNTPFTQHTRGMFTTASVAGRIHADVFHMVRFLAMIGALKTNTYTLGEVYNEMFGRQKKSVPKNEIWKMWNEEKGRDTLIEYSLDDADSTYQLGEYIFPIFVEIARVAGLAIDDAVSSTAGQLVEMVLLKEAHRRGVLAPNRPKESEATARESEPIEGAYVKVPPPGVYSNIVVFDFRSLYPSIIVSHNISPETLNCTCCSEEEAHTSPDGLRFCSKKKGIVPEVLANILHHRAILKRQMKSLDRNSDEYRYAYARQYAFKIIANAFYGMLRYVRARWYCRECAAATTAWERFYIKGVIEKAEREGFNVLYSDTDSIFIELKDRTEKDALAFMDGINKSLPKDMELELEDFYTRGVFVAKKSGKAGAKKKYALLSRDGHIKIRGFELVRRDWSEIAKQTQRRVLETVLRDGSVDKALKIINDVVEGLRAKRVPVSDLVIYTLLRKDVEDYKAVGPEVAAAKKGIARGLDIKEGYMIGYVITGKGGSISDKAELADYVEEGDYDPDYYINNQVLPAVEKILGELGYEGEVLKTGKRQQGLSDWL